MAEWAVNRAPDLTALHHKRQNVLHLLVTDMKELKDQFNLTELIKELVIQHPAFLQEYDGEGHTPILLAAAKNRVPTTVALAATGANLQERDPDGNTLLHHLASYLCSLSNEDHAYSYKLMKLELDFNARNHNGDTPLSKYILSFNDQPETFFGDVFVEQLKGFRKYGADFHTINTAGESPLHLAARIPWHETDANGLNFATFLSDNSGDHSLEAFKCLMDMGLDPLQEDHL